MIIESLIAIGQECMEDNKFQWIMDRGYLIEIYPATLYWIV